MVYLLPYLAGIAALGASMPQIIPSSVPPSISPVSKAPNFNIIPAFAQDLPLARALQGWRLTSSHISDCVEAAVFTNVTRSFRTFYANGTAEQFTNRDSNIAVDGGPLSTQWNVVVASTPGVDKFNQGRRMVYINCREGEQGTPGVQVADFPGTIYYGTGTFYVCQATLPLTGSHPILYYRDKIEPTPEGCANVELQAWCVSDTTVHEHQRDSTCYGKSISLPRTR